MHGGAEIEEVHPRTETSHWAAAAAGGCLILGLVSKDPSYLFLGAMCLALLLVTYIPAISLWLPGLLK